MRAARAAVAIRSAGEQGHAQALLELAYRLAERRRRHPEVFRCDGVAPAASDGDERIEGVERGEGHRLIAVDALLRRQVWPMLTTAATTMSGRGTHHARLGALLVD